MLAGRRHLIWDLASGEKRLFDLSIDPQEQEAVPIEGASGAEFGRLLAAHVETLSCPLEVAASPLSAEHVEQLRVLGYVGD